MLDTSPRNLWDEWKELLRRRDVPRNRFWVDGIIDRDSYAKAAPRTLFVLKEANQDLRENADRDLTTFLADGPRYALWHSVARLAAGLAQGFPPFEAIDKRAVMTEALRSVAVMNLKKTAGGPSADMRTINAYALAGKHLLRRQIGEMRPEVIVACGTFEQVAWLLDLRVSLLEPTKTPVRAKGDGPWVIPFRHPVRYSNRQAYADLKHLWHYCLASNVAP